MAGSGSGDAVLRSWKFNVPLNALVINRRGDTIAASFGDGVIALLEANDLVEEPKKMKAHEGVSLSLAPDADEHAFLSGGDDGRIVIIDPTLDIPTPIAHQPKKWIDAVAGSVEGHRAYSIGKRVFLLNDEGKEIATFDIPSPAGGLAFSLNGKRLAVSHYNGVSLYWTNATQTEVEVLPWKGSHLGMIWSPDSKILLTSMQEGALHGWLLSDKKEMQMNGYAAKIRSMAFTSRGRYLATSGADQIVCWPFIHGGPWNKPPVMLGGGNGALVTSVAPNQKDEVVAAGYEDGMIILAPLDGRMEVVIHPPIAEKGSAVIGLEWNAEGDCLFAGLEDGTVHLFSQKSVMRAVTYR